VIERVARLDDPRVAAYAHVGDAAWLREHDRFVAEGRLVVRRLIEDQPSLIESVLVTPAAAAALGGVLATMPAGCPAYICDPEDLRTLSGINFHRGCLAVARRPSMPAVGSLATARLLVALERVSDPDNVGSIFRSALAFGAGGVILDRASADPFYRKAIRTSMAAVLRVPFTRVDSWPDALQTLGDAGFTLIALTPDASATDIGAFPPARPERIVLLLGSEGEGLSSEALDAADLRVRIPIDARGDSLNVAVAAGIALHRLSWR
jgi:tRNA G18 (ribose-2'-O)-methylase SpoU